MKEFILATAILMSTIVGVGMFGIPYAAAQSGFLIAAAFLFFLTIIMTLIHSFYGEIVLRTKEKHRLAGYAGYYLGERWKQIVGFFVVLGFYGSLLVYIIVGGNFLYLIFAPVVNLPAIVFNLIFFAIGSVAVYFGIRFIAGMDLLMGLFLILIVVLFLYLGLNQINIDNLKTINISNIIAPYGVILYSLAGMAAVPEIISVFKRKKEHCKKAIILGTVIPGILYFIFMATVIGLTGGKTSLEAINGLAGILGKKAVFFGSVFGFLAAITSFFILGLSLKATYIYDFGFHKNWAWFITCFTPLILLALGFQNFIVIITILGALLGLIECTSVILIHKKAVPTSNRLSYFLVLIFVIGFIYTLIKLF